MKLKNFKYSYNRFYKIYRVQLFDNGQWQKTTYDKNNFEVLISNNLKTSDQIRNYPYKPYFLYIIEWLLMDLWKWTKKTDPKLKKVQNSAFFAILLFASMFFINNFLENKKQDKIERYEQELKLKDQTIQNYATFSDSLLTEIKKKELIIEGGFEQALQKDSILKNDND